MLGTIHSEEDDLSLVFDALLPVSAKWSMLCCHLGLRASLLGIIKKNHPGDVNQCLLEGLLQWVQRNYNTEKHGPPTWRSLVAAVDNSSGGDNHKLALEIAEKHQGECDYFHYFSVILLTIHAVYICVTIADKGP